MKKSVLTLIGALTLCSTTSHAASYILSGNMDVLQAGTNGGFGVGTGSGTGTIAGTYDDVTNLLDYTLTWQNLSSTVTNMHFHVAPTGSSGGVALGIPGPWSSPQVATNVGVSASGETSLLAGNWYVNVHTSNFGGGEIRGQVIVTQVPEPASSTLALGGLATLLLRRQRR